MKVEILNSNEERMLIEELIKATKPLVFLEVTREEANVYQVLCPRKREGLEPSKIIEDISLPERIRNLIKYLDKRFYCYDIIR